MVGCDLNPLDQHTQYFYSLAGEGEEDSSKTIKYRSDGHTIIMSRGEQGEELSELEAEDLINQTTFTLTLDGTSLASKSVKTVDDLGSGYHVVESFDLGKKSPGEYELIGSTTGNMSRTNKVFLTIKKGFLFF